MSTDTPAIALARFAVQTDVRDGVVRDAQVSLDSRQDGEPVMRVMLLLEDRVGDT